MDGVESELVVSLSVSKVKTGYANVEVLHGVDLTAGRNRITAILGPNGCGKSTLMHIITGIVPIWEGEVFLWGRPITHLTPQKRASEGISLVPQGRRIFPQMTVLENLEMGGYLLKDTNALEGAISAVYDEFPVLKRKRNDLASNLSSGEQTTLCIARALMSNPKVLLLDEPSIGLAPMIVTEVFQQIQALAQGRTILLIEQNVRKALSIADYVYLMDQGSNVADGTPSTISSNEHLAELYLGSIKGRP